MIDDKFWEVYRRTLIEIFGYSEWTVYDQLMPLGKKKAEEDKQYDPCGMWNDCPYWLAADVTGNSQECITKHMDKYDKIVKMVDWHV